MKLILLVPALLAASASAFSPLVSNQRLATQLYGEQKPDWNTAAEMGWSMGGEDYTRAVETKKDEDARKSIHEAPSFEEYMKQRQQGGG